MSTRTNPPSPMTKRSTPAGAAMAPVDTIRRDLVALRRLFQRRDLGAMWSAAYGASDVLDYADVRLLDAVHACQSRGPSDGVTVGAVSLVLGVDPSRASRLVAGAVGKGLLTRVAAQDDGRKVVLRITEAGAALLAKGGEVSLSRIAQALAVLPKADQKRFAELLAVFVAAVTDDGSG